MGVRVRFSPNAVVTMIKLILGHDKMKLEYQRFLLTEFVALIQKKYKLEVNDFIFENKYSYEIVKPKFNIQVYTPKEAEVYGIVFTFEFIYFKITRFLY